MSDLKQLEQKLSIANLKVNGQIFSGGQPTEEDFALLNQAGCKLVVNLRPPQEMVGNPQQELLEKLGMQYVQLPVANASDFSVEKAKELDAALKQIDGLSLVHCLSGNRVGALFALKAFFVEGKTVEQSIEIGRQFGLTKAEPMIQQMLLQA